MLKSNNKRQIQMVLRLNSFGKLSWNQVVPQNPKKHHLIMNLNMLLPMVLIV
jgi:hypothetical protein